MQKIKQMKKLHHTANRQESMMLSAKQQSPRKSNPPRSSHTYSLQLVATLQRGCRGPHPTPHGPPSQPPRTPTWKMYDFLRITVEALLQKESFEKYVIEQLKPDVINIEETKLRKKAQINHKECFLFCLNRPEGGGGIATMVANKIKKHATKIAENNDNDEYMVVRLEHVKPALNIVHVYGRVEGRTGPEKVLEDWKQIMKELNRIQAKHEAILLIGDLKIVKQRNLSVLY